MPKLLNIFSGRQSGIQPFLDAGWEAVTVELEERFPNTTITRDALQVSADELRAYGPFDFLWASVPCTSFSMASVRNHWTASGPCLHCGQHTARVGQTWVHQGPTTCETPSVRKADLTYAPKSETGQEGRDLLRHTLHLVHELQPRWWVIENPRALMRKMPELQDVPVHTVTHCQYGDPRRMKPTDLFGKLPPAWEAKACTNGSPCHEAAPRGSKTGTQGLKNAEERSLVPYDLPASILHAIEHEREAA